MSETRIVVGSGPNGVGVAHALLARGFHVTMLDVGRSLEPEIAATVAKMARQEPNEWTDSDKATVQRMAFSSSAAPNPKLSFGSSYAYAIDGQMTVSDGISLYGSHAFGGLSNVWGCALLRSTPADLAGSPDEVVQGVLSAYPRVEELVTQSIGVDIFASHSNSTHLCIADEAQAVLRRHRLSGDRSAIDVYPTPLAIAADCKACNGCMYGCVYGYTYSTRSTVEKMFLPNPRFTYVPHVAVTRYEESQTGVAVYARDQKTGEEIAYSGRQLFLAAGMMGTLRILWESNPAVTRTLEASDSSCFILPGVRTSLQPVAHSRHHGQSHLSVDLRDPPFDEKAVHFQLYFNNPAVADGLAAKHFFLRNAWFRHCLDRANEYLVIAQGYIHSDFCHSLLLSCASDGRIAVSVKRNPCTKAILDTALSSVKRRMRGLGIRFFPSLADVKPFGGSKSAGALRHAVIASPHTTDILGRPFGSKNVFIVDSTVLASTPGRNITLTTLANAYRIGQHAPQ